MQAYSIHDFAGAANQEFSVEMAGGSTTFTLVSVNPLPPQPAPGMTREPFSLIFKNASAIIFPQKIYRVKNPRIGEFELFLVPIGRDGSAVLYQSVFN